MERRRRQAERQSSFSRREAVPGDERERLAISLREASERVEHGLVVARRLPVVVRSPFAKPVMERLAPSGGSTLGSDHVSGDADQPRERVGGDVVQPPPRDQERLGDDIVNGFVANAPPRIRDDRGVVFADELLQPTLRIVGFGHRLLLAGNAPILTGPGVNAARSGTLWTLGKAAGAGAGQPRRHRRQ